ncbi:hypothetical protein DFJ63DRAFT_335756 [Scheffersomyces coipomensis]|uniref:uncharacterized protein n=1 Tax=Scheffersomyces coipomensis TaxID=1788519 RepID=UPI00315DB1AE
MSKVDVVDITQEDIRVDQRFHLFPYERLEAFSITGGIIGGFAGFFDGIKVSSLQYLTENGHRLPTTVGGWYFYHKKKNYVMILNGAQNGFKQGLKYTVSVGGFFGLEFLIDRYIRNDIIDFTSSLAAGTIYAGLFGLYSKLSKIQIQKYMKKGAAVGLSLGLTQDLLIFTRGGHVWYLEKLGIRNPQVNREQRLL